MRVEKRDASHESFLKVREGRLKYLEINHFGHTTKKSELTFIKIT